MTLHNTAPKAQDDGAASVRHGRRVLSVTSLTALLTGLNTSGLDVALPGIVRHFDASAAQASWMILGYLLAGTVLLLVWGRLADLFGRCRLYVAGVAVFTLASVGCALAPDAWWLVLGRILQGVGASAVIANTTALLADAFPPERLPRALGINATLISATQAAGPLLGGVLTKLQGWSGIFWTSGAAGLVACGWAVHVLRPDRGSGSSEKFDVAGALLSVLFLGGGALALTESGSRGWTSGPVLLSAAVSVSALLVFPLVQWRQRHPLVDPWLFRDRRRAMALLAAFLTAMSYFSVVLVMSLYLQTVERLDALSAGFQVMLMAVGAMLASPVAGRLATRRPARLLSSVGTATSALGIALLVLALSLGPPAPTGLVGLGLFLTGVGAGLFGVPNTGELMSLVPAHRRGIANGVRSMLQNAGYLISSVLALALVAGHVPSGGPAGGDVRSSVLAAPGGPDALVGQHRTALLVLLGLCLAATASSLLRGGAQRPVPPPDRTIRPAPPRTSPHRPGKFRQDERNGVTVEYPILKAHDTDFVVQESMVLPVQDDQDAPFQYLRLRKRGYTTFEAVERIAAVCGVPASDLSTAGLKDEDAVTEQHLACRGGLSPDGIAEFNTRHGSGERTMRLSLHGYGHQGLRAGHLEGNGFRIIVRGLSAGFVRTVEALGERAGDLFFVNYYDTQRFGVAGGPRTTHQIGRALLEEDHGTALGLVRESKSPEAERARLFTGSAAAFFDRIDPRVRAFYLCAHASYVWNAQLAALLRKVGRHPLDETVREGIPYTFATHRDDVLALLQEATALPYERHRWDGGEMRRTQGLRPTVVQTRVRVDRTGEDTDTPGRHACELTLFLPSGCYATNAVAQWVAWAGSER